MENINALIACLLAVENFGKDIHYNCPGEAFYAMHQLADRIGDGMSDFIDQLKETAILGNGGMVLPSGEYLEKATRLIPEIDTMNNRSNFQSMRALLLETIGLTNSLQNVDRATSKLLDDISDNLQNSLGLINIQLRGIY